MLEPLLITAMLLSASPQPAPGAGDSPRQQVPWREIRSGVEESICMKAHELPDGTTAWAPLAGLRDLCGAGPPSTPAARLADQAVTEILPVLASLKPEGLDRAFDGGLSPEERTHRVREAYLGSGDFLDLLLSHLLPALEREGLACDGCPERQAVEPRRVRWDEVAPYVAAHAWPDDVVTIPASGPESKEKRSYGMHFCAGINGISEMDSPDPLLTRAGFMGMFHSKEAHSLATNHFRAVRDEEAFGSLTDDTSRTEYLRRRLPEELAADPALRTAVCPTLEQHSADLRLIVEECRPGI